MKEILKKLIKKLPIAITLNQKYDAQTKAVIKKVCKADSNCIDVGCHKGEVLDIILHHAPKGTHYAFEPIPLFYQKLKEQYTHCHVYNVALSNMKGEASFNYVVSNPAYSGLIKRSYDRANEVDEKITVQTDCLDAIIPADVKIDFIKIDVEGGELQVLQGAMRTIKRCRPIIIFEHGLGASEFYKTEPKQVFSLLQQCGLQVSTMQHWLAEKKAMDIAEFERQFYQKVNYYFIAYP